MTSSNELMTGYALGRDSNGGNSGNGMGMWGDSGWWVLIILFAMIWGWGGNGFGGGNNGANAFLPYAIGNNGALTREQACIDNNFQNLMRETAGISDAVNRGIATLDTRVCQQSYETAGLVNNLGNTVQQGFMQAELSRCNQQALLMQQLNQMQAASQQCCCDQRAAIENVRFTIAQEDCATRNLIQSTTRDMIDSNNANTRAILEKLTAQEIAAKDAQIAAQNQKLFAAELAASQSAQNAYLINTLRPFPVAAYQVCNPFTGTYGYQGYGSAAYGGCGCGCGCGN